MEIVKMEHVTKIYGEGDTRVWGLDDVSLSIEKGETVAIVGASGSGKSTMLHVMGGVDTPNSGNVIIDGKDITRLNDEEMSVFRRRKIGFVFQAYHLIPAKGRPLRNRELRDVLPENNQGINVVPQLLTNSGEGFVKAAKFLKKLGYGEVNINLGCPSKTVVTKYKGSGLLYDTERLDNFLYEVFAAGVMDVSIKTRIGRDSSAEFEDIIDIYKKYPVSELIIHPRVQTDFYKNTPNMEVFAEGVAAYGRTDTVCYNGDINSVADYERFIGN